MVANKLVAFILLINLVENMRVETVLRKINRSVLMVHLNLNITIAQKPHKIDPSAADQVMMNSKILVWIQRSVTVSGMTPTSKREAKT